MSQNWRAKILKYLVKWKQRVFMRHLTWSLSGLNVLIEKRNWKKLSHKYNNNQNNLN